MIKKYLVTYAHSFYAPDGKLHKAAWGCCRKDGDILQIGSDDKSITCLQTDALFVMDCPEKPVTFVDGNHVPIYITEE